MKCVLIENETYVGFFGLNGIFSIYESKWNLRLF